MKINPDAQRTEYGLPPETPAQAEAAGIYALLQSKGSSPTVGALRDSTTEAMTPTAAIGQQELSEAMEALQKYKGGKANYESRIKSNEKWWRLRHWDELRSKQPHAGESPEPASAWLFNSILNKHADAMDNYPEPVCLPREPSDEESAKTLSAILPVIMEDNEFESTYSYEWWEKLKHGAAIYGVFWDSGKENGLGDISIDRIDPLNIFWEPGVEDIQDSRNLFILSLVDRDLIEADYPEYAGQLGGKSFETTRYDYDDTVDTSGKVTVIDWYYKRRTNGRTVLHYARFTDPEHLLYASENDEQYTEKGWYWDGEYPVVVDALFPEKGSPMGFGYIDIARDPQLYIDKLWSNILETSLINTKRRFLVSESVNVNEDELRDVNSPFIHVGGQVSDERIRELTMRPLDSVYANIVSMKIDELKETSANRDVSNGGVSGGVTAAAAVAALQEAGNKASRDMIAAGYRADTRIVRFCISRMRQFYDTERSFRITNEMPYKYASVGPQQLADQVTGQDSEGNDLFRRPIFDIKIKAHKKNPFSRAEQNERAKELYQMGFFSPERAQESSIALDMMDFEGIDKIRSQVNEGAKLYNIVQQQGAELQKALAIIQALTGKDMGVTNTQGGASMAQGGGASASGGSGLARAEADAQAQQTPYMQRLAENSKPNMAASYNAANPQ